jgi:hypothetical protein
MNDLESARPGKVGKQFPASGVNGNTAPVAQANNYGDRLGWVVALILGLIAIVAVAFLFAVVRSIGADLNNIRGLIENSAAAASSSAVDAARAAERSNTAERRAATSEIYAKQIYVELNRLGYPVRTPAEEHEPNPPGSKP